MNNVKNQIVPHIFDRVHNAYYGYGTIIGLVTPEGVIHEDFDALVLFDERNTDLHCAYNYEYWNLTTGFKKCEPYFPTSEVVRANRCLWVRVYAASTADVVLYEDEVRLVPFGTLEYRQHPIRVKLKCAYSQEMHSASIVAIDRDKDYSIIAFDKEVNEEFLRSHDGKGLTTYYDTILKTLWPAKDVYYWTKINNDGIVNGKDLLSFDEELLGTVPPFDMNDKEKEDADEEKKDVEEGEDTVASPFYYKIARVEPNELMTDLMSFEQHEGFLWGNIIKYAYRYGNKGEKAETVKKIRKYCDMLLEILEPKSELED